MRMDDLEKRVAAWVKSPEGKKSLQETAEAVRKMNIDAEQNRRDDIRWWHENKHKPMTI